MKFKVLKVVAGENVRFKITNIKSVLDVSDKTVELVESVDDTSLGELEFKLKETEAEKAKVVVDYDIKITDLKAKIAECTRLGIGQ